MKAEKWPILYSGFTSIVKDPGNGYEVVSATDSVGVLMYDLINDIVILVNQYRSPMAYRGYDNGFINEVPAGRFDKNIGVRGLVVEEVQEETKVTVSEDDVVILNNGNPLALCPGSNTEMMYLAAVEVDLSGAKIMAKGLGCHEEGENITRFSCTINEFISMIHCDMKTHDLAKELEIIMLKKEIALLKKRRLR